MPIYPLPVMSEEQERKAIDKLEPPKTMVVRYGYLRQVGEFPYGGDQVVGCGAKLIVRTPRGVEMGEMLTTTCPNSGCGKSVSRQQMLDYIDRSGGKQYPFTTRGKVLRVATVEDLNEAARIESEKPAMIKLAKAKIRELKLPMRLVDVEQLVSRDKVIFYFSCEDRVDFRDLVRQLAAELHERIEMRQVGARDEARVAADYEKCGQHCCCRQFLKVLKPVSMKSAKIQKATLDPSKISGRCGRLMCCLRYEDQTYDELRKNLPHRNSKVLTEDGVGRVVSTQILTQLVLVELEATRQRQAYAVESLEKLTEARAAELVAEAQEEARQAAERASRARAPRREPRRPRPGKPLREAEVESKEGERSARPPSDDAAPARSKGGRSQRDRSQPSAGAKGGSDDPAAAPRKKRRRRRRGRRGKGPGGGDGGGSGGGGGNAGGGDN